MPQILFVFFFVISCAFFSCQQMKDLTFIFSLNLVHMQVPTLGESPKSFWVRKECNLRGKCLTLAKKIKLNCLADKAMDVKTSALVDGVADGSSGMIVLFMLFESMFHLGLITTNIISIFQKLTLESQVFQQY